MKKLFKRTLSILCAVMLLISAVSAWATAEEEPATPTDLNPAEGEVLPEEPAGEPEGEHGEEDIGSVEVVITKALTVGQTWEGKMKKTKPVVLKLDVNRAGPVYMLVEGKDVWATVEKSDRQTEAPTRTETDPETDRMILTIQAEEGSYLITLGPTEPNLMAMATVSFMDKSTYEAWEAEQTEKETEPDENDGNVVSGEEETEPSIVEDKESEDNSVQITSDEEQPAENEQIAATNLQRSITVEVIADEPEPVVGDTVHFKAILHGYDGLNYTMQWQYSEDKQDWHDISNEVNETMDVLVTPENNTVYWRILVYLEEEQEE